MDSDVLRPLDRLGRIGRAALTHFLLLVALPAAGHAAQERPTGTIEGRVLGERSEALAGIRVELVELGRGTVTDDLGRYRFLAVPDGRHTLRFGALDRAPAERVVSVAAETAVVPDVRLAIAALPLTPLEVIERRTRLAGVATRIPGSAQVIDREQLEAAITPFDDVHQMVRRVPGVNVQEEDGYGLRPNIGMRGSGSERSSKITLMEDGVLIAPAPYAAPSAYYFPVAARMRAIEVRKGSSQIKYGPRTIGGALNLVSSAIPAAGFDWSAEVTGAGDDTRRAQVRLGGTAGRFGWLAEGYGVDTDGFKRLPDAGDTGFDVQDYVAKLRWSTGPGSGPGRTGPYQQIEVKLGYTDELSNETYLGLTDEDFAASPRRRYAASQRDVMNADHRQLQIRHFLQAGQRLDLTTTVYRNEFSRNWYKLQGVAGSSLASVLDEPGSFADELAILRGADSEGADLRVRANDRDYYSQGVQTALAARARTGAVGHELELGARVHADQEDRFQHEDAYRMAAGRMVLEEPGAPGSQSNRVSDARAWAFYVEDRIDLGRLALTPGLRLETVDFTRTDYAGDDPDRVVPTRVRANGVTALLPGVGATLGLGSARVESGGFEPGGFESGDFESGGLGSGRPGSGGPGWGGRLFAGVHRGFGPPGPGADESTEPEESLNYELGVAFERPGSTVQVVGFYNDYDNVLGAATLATGADGTGELFNGGAAEIWGVEASAAVELAPAGAVVRVPVRLAYTFTDARFRSSFESDFEAWGTVRSGDELPYIPRHQLFGTIGVAGGSWHLALELAASGRMRTVAGQGAIPAASATDAYATLGVGAEVRLSDRGALFAGVQNLTDRRYIVARRPAGARPGLPRTIEAGIRVGG